MTDTAADYTPPSHLAADITARIRDNHKDCPDVGPGSCVLAFIFTDDVQEILDLATPIATAAELRRLAGGRELGGISYRDLLARADVLDPPVGVAERRED